MSNQKYNPPNSPPPYTNDISSPQSVHVQPQSQQGSDYYGASPPLQNTSPYQQNGSYSQNNGYPPPNQGGYYPPGPQMYQQPQQQNGPYYGQQQQGYGPGGPYGPSQGGYYREDRGMGAGGGCFAAMCGVLAACCCLDLLF